MNRLRLIKVRKVATPNRGNVGDAGLDFYVPNDLTFDQLVKANEGSGVLIKSYHKINHYIGGMVMCRVNDNNDILNIVLTPGSRVLIPSGIRVLLEPINSMLTAANKSGLAKKGLVYTAQVVDSPYTGEVHIGIANIGQEALILEPGKKAAQFIHVPVFLTDPEEISNEEYDKLAFGWGTRGDNGFGSTGE